MLHWPQRWKWVEGRSSRIKYVQGFLTGLSVLADNIFVRLAGLPSEGVNTTQKRKEKITVSLTSFPARINQTYYAIKSLMHQTVKPDRIVLWLSAQQFPQYSLPSKFQKLIERGLEVRFEDDDLRSHKKYFYALQEQERGELVITYDDDIIYDSKSIEKLIEKHQHYPENVVCNRGVTLSPTTDGWVRRTGVEALYTEEGLNEPSFLLIPSTGNGCLYPHGVLLKSAFDKVQIKRTAFTADDIWIWFNCLMAGVGVVKTIKKSRALSLIINSQREKLSFINDDRGQNNRVLEELRALYQNDIYNRKV